MIFTYKKWESFCKRLASNEFHSISAKDVSSSNNKYIVLKHDVETNVNRAYALAKIENKYGHKGTYYVQAYLLNNSNNLEILKKIQALGHEVSYHFDVMDSCKGDLDKAIKEFESNKEKFESNGFEIKTLCQHGNPIVERVGYTSNRDFFRSERVKASYPHLSDIMVNFKEKYNTEFTYFSDAGRKFKMIYDPLFNDVVKSDDKDIAYKDLNELFDAIDKDGGNIISTHPHRWTKFAALYLIKAFIFKCIKFVAKILVKIPFMKKFMNRFYYLAKKI